MLRLHDFSERETQEIIRLAIRLQTTEERADATASKCIAVVEAEHELAVIPADNHELAVIRAAEEVGIAPRFLEQAKRLVNERKLRTERRVATIGHSLRLATALIIAVVLTQQPGFRQKIKENATESVGAPQRYTYSDPENETDAVPDLDADFGSNSESDNTTEGPVSTNANDMSVTYGSSYIGIVEHGIINRIN